MTKRDYDYHYGSAAGGDDPRAHGRPAPRPSKAEQVGTR